MKKFILGLLFVLSSSLSAQTYLRAETFTIGIRSSESSPIQWGESNPCSILIECYSTKVVINSKVTQTYHVINQSFSGDEINSWLCKDVNGTTCKFTIMKMYKYPGFVVCQIEYNDALWFYVCVKE